MDHALKSTCVRVSPELSSHTGLRNRAHPGSLSSGNMEPSARRLHRLVEPIHLVTYFADEPTEALMRSATGTLEASGFR